MKAAVFLPLCLLFAGCCALRPPPRFGLAIPPQFDHLTKRTSFRQGAQLVDDPLLGPINRAERPVAVVSGQALNPSFVSYTGGGYGTGAEQRGWSVEVKLGCSARVLRALRTAKDGYEADLGSAINSSPRIYPRFRRKQFSWGEAVSFLVQYQSDMENCVPNNGLLCYEVHGVTHDRRYTVRAVFGVTHPRLVEFGPKVRAYPFDAPGPRSPIRRDPDYLLVERCSDREFQPSIRDIDGMIDTLRPGATR
jgi:hypothetical protein